MIFSDEKNGVYALSIIDDLRKSSFDTHTKGRSTKLQNKGYPREDSLTLQKLEQTLCSQKRNASVEKLVIIEEKLATFDKAADDCAVTGQQIFRYRNN